VGLNLDIVGTKGEPQRTTWTSTDCLLYALSVGAGAEDPSRELAFTTENTAGVTQRALPGMAVVVGPLAGGNSLDEIGSIDETMVVHGEQGITFHRELPVEGTLVAVSEVVGLYDKGKGALVVTQSTCVLAGTSEPLFDLRSSLFIKGEGGWGGDRGPRSPLRGPLGPGSAPASTRPLLPERPADAEVTYATRRDQALLYRLNGDRFPLHSDPEFAIAAGFDRPILHGLCTYGFTTRALLAVLCDEDPARFTSVDGRFSSPVMPGESLTVRIWRTGQGAATFQTFGDDGRVVIDAGVCAYVG
jgi:acyl dehydratase